MKNIDAFMRIAMMTAGVFIYQECFGASAKNDFFPLLPLMIVKDERHPVYSIYPLEDVRLDDKAISIVDSTGKTFSMIVKNRVQHPVRFYGRSDSSCFLP